MDIEVQEVSPCVKRISVNVPVDEISPRIDTQLGELARRAKVPGFRQGKAPRPVIRKMYGKQVHGDVSQKVIDEAFRKALADNDLNPVGDPMVESLVVEEGAPISLVATVEVFPKIALAPFDGLTLTRKIRPVDEDEIETVITQYRERQARFTPVEGRGVAEGDYITIDYSATKADGAPLEHFKGEGRQAHVDKEQMFEGFYEGILGMTKGQTKEFDAPMPEDYPDTGIAGKPVTFKITLHEIKAKSLPEADDELAREVSDFDTMAELVADIRKGAEERAKDAADGALKSELLAKLIEANPMELPPGLLERQAASTAQRRARQFAQQGIDLAAAGIDAATMAERSRTEAVRSLKEQVILASFGEAHKVTLEEGDIDREVAKLAAMFGQSPEMTRQQLSQGGGLEALANQAYADKVTQAMLARVTVTDEPTA
ncbi:MAG: trigger factor [Nitrospinae bacterium]|nr:trigger factor [Nitrospinota bacterium]